MVLTYDEEISFEIKSCQLTYFFLDGDYQARAVGDLPDDCFTRHLPLSLLGTGLG